MARCVAGSGVTASARCAWSCSRLSVASPASITCRPSSSTQIDRHVPGCVTRCVDDHDAPVLAEREAAGKRSEGRAAELEGLRCEPGWQRLAQHAPHDFREGGVQIAQLGGVDSNGRADVDGAVDVVAVVMGQDHLRDVLAPAGRQSSARTAAPARRRRRSVRRGCSGRRPSHRYRRAAGGPRARSPSSESASARTSRRAGRGRPAGGRRSEGAGRNP